MATRVGPRSRNILHNSIESAIPENPLVAGANICGLSVIEATIQKRHRQMKCCDKGATEYGRPKTLNS